MNQETYLTYINLPWDLSSKVACIIYDSRVTAMDFLIDHIHALNEGFTAKDANHDLFVLHIQIPKYLGLGFEFGLQRIWD